MLPLIQIEASFETLSLSHEESGNWQENTIILLHQKAETLINVYAGETLLGQGRLVAHRGQYAIQLVTVS